jgi:hypothetical protein
MLTHINLKEITHFFETYSLKSDTDRHTVDIKGIGDSNPQLKQFVVQLKCIKQNLINKTQIFGKIPPCAFCSLIKLSRLFHFFSLPKNFLLIFKPFYHQINWLCSRGFGTIQTTFTRKNFSTKLFAKVIDNHKDHRSPTHNLYRSPVLEFCNQQTFVISSCRRRIDLLGFEGSGFLIEGFSARFLL